MRKTLIIIVSVIVGAIIGTVVLVFGVLPTFEDECAGDECTQTDGPTLVPVPLPTRMPTREKAYKPVLYLYPQEERQLAVTLDVEGELGTVYPAPERQVQTEEGTRASWTISAAPDGTLTDASGRSYPYVFWEGPVRQDTPEQGFIVAREDAVPFLEEKLGQLGLSDKEAADFITYWAPRIRANEYTFVSFDASSYTAHARYSFTDEAGAPVKPDTFIRVFMTIRQAEVTTQVREQAFGPTPQRTGVVAVEWGGTEEQ